MSFGMVFVAGCWLMSCWLIVIKIELLKVMGYGGFDFPQPPFGMSVIHWDV